MENSEKRGCIVTFTCNSNALIEPAGIKQNWDWFDVVLTLLALINFVFVRIKNKIKE